MFALGCLQSQSCHTDRCPVGVATQDQARQRALVVPDKAERVFHFHRSTIKALAELIAAAGLEHPADVRPLHIAKRLTAGEVSSYADVYRFLKPGELIDGTDDPRFQTAWAMARAESFLPVG
jgi:hypothetical protein